MPRHPGYEALRHGRDSLSQSRYFVTLTTHGRQPGLHAPSLAPILKREITALETDLSWTILGAVIMPDHIHLLIRLGHRLTLGQCIGRFKAKTRVFLATTALRWQGYYFDRHLRPDDSMEAILRYIFLNPYRAELIRATEHYRWTWFGVEEQRWFAPMTDDNRPFPEWLR